MLSSTRRSLVAVLEWLMVLNKSYVLIHSGLRDAPAGQSAFALAAMILTRTLPKVGSALAAAFLQQANIRNCHRLVNRFAHVIDRQRSHADGRQRFHLHSGNRMGGNTRFNLRAIRNQPNP